MGEIAEALKRAREERREERSQRTRADGPFPQPEPVEAPAGRAASAPTLPRTAAAAPAPEPVPSIAAGGELAHRIHLSRHKDGAWPARLALIEPKSAAAEAYRQFAIHVRRTLAQRQAKSVLLVSAVRLEGKTTTSCNLALTLTALGGESRVALVDLDLRRPSVGRYLGAHLEAGVEQVLRGQIPLEEAGVRTDVPGLDIFPVGRPESQASELLCRAELPELLRQLESRYDLVVIDSAPLLLVPDTEILLPHVRSCIAVARARHSRCGAFRDMVETLPPGVLLGSFLNDAPGSRHRARYGYYSDETPRDTREA
ncbi:MAG: CpsD/CapB family tyrosine-protein kinase [Proteobacteria bacterium]|nr:CpsD/CapB family tyrosine-protein kinase [Pseudomonadota bacterium]